MGCYVDPEDMSKEQWLAANATEIAPGTEDQFTLRPGEVLVCLVDNGPFTAAGVAYSPQERRVFANPDDGRPKRWFVASIEDVRKVSPYDSYTRRD